MLMIEETVHSLNNEDTQDNESIQKNIDPPSYNNTLQSISMEDIKTIKKQIECQSNIIKELEIILENQKKKV